MTTTQTLPSMASVANAPTQQGTDGPATLLMLPTVEIAQLGSYEMVQHRRGEPVGGAYGFELFRRAIVERDDVAWMAISELYAPLVRRWLGHCQDDDGVEVRIVTTFERFWQAMTSDKFSRFASLAAVLGYLKMCARSECLDRQRITQTQSLEGPLDEQAHALPSPDNLEEQVIRAGEAGAFWGIVQECLVNAREREVVYLSYVRGLAPRDICARFSDHFPTVAEVYRIKHNALDRLRRSAALSALR